jgi:hypothetical protein
MVNSGDIASVTIGRTVRIPRDVLLEFTGGYAPDESSVDTD